jgi:hypothetical protein
VKRLIILFLSSAALAQVSGVGSIVPVPNGGTGTSIYDGVVSSGLIGQYRMLPTETASALVDYSGNGNNATGTIGTAPTIIATTGGVNFPGTGAISLPSALNSAKTFMFFTTLQMAAQTSTQPCVLVGSGANSSAAFLALELYASDQSGGTVAGKGGIGDRSSGAFLANSNSNFDGTGILTLTLPSSGGDQIYFNNTLLANNSSASSGIGAQSTGNFQLGGAAAAGSAFGTATYIIGQIYYALFYSRALTTAEIAANVAAVTTAMQQRQVAGALAVTQTTNGTNNYVADGDSITAGIGTTEYPFNVTLNGTWAAISRAWTATPTSAMMLGGGATSPDILFQSTAAQNVLTAAIGTNDLRAGTLVPVLEENLVAYARARRALGWKLVLGTIPTSTPTSNDFTDANKDLYNNYLRQNWTLFADGLADFAADPNFGADGVYTNSTYFQSDNIHPTQGTAYNIQTPVAQHAINRLYACHSFSCANTYTTGAAAATSVTAASESTNTMTFTTALHPNVGQMATCTGITPSGYNSSDQGWLVLTSSSTQFTAYNYATGLGAGTIFGACSVPEQLDTDVYVILAGTATSPSFTLESCIGYTGQNLYLKNENTTSPWVITPFQNSETIDGATSLTMPTASSSNYPVVILQSQLISASAAGCTWARLQ